MLVLLACAEPDVESDPFVVPDPPENGIQLHVPAVTLAPGEERERCLYLPTTEDTDAWVSAIELVSRPGLHHAMLVKAPEERADEEECFGIPEALMSDYTNVPEPVFASSTQVTEERVEFPDGVALPLPARQPMMVDYHLINTSDEDTTGELWINLEFTDTASEAARLYVMANITGIDVPAQGEQELTTTCSFPADANVFSLTPHMHRHGTSFQATLVQDVDTPLLDTQSWSNPETAWFDPTLSVSAGDAIRFTCSYVNDGDTPIGFGPSADDEMCMLFGYHWPADDLLWRADYDESACTSP